MSLKLSEAIRAGAKLRPQAVGDLFVNGGSCVLGAAYEGATGKTCRNYSDLHPLFPQLFEKSPYGTWTLNQLGKDMYGKNDIDRMTREEIADWIEQNYESKLPQKERESDEAYTKRVLAEITHQHPISELTC